MSSGSASSLKRSGAGIVPPPAKRSTRSQPTPTDEWSGFEDTIMQSSLLKYLKVCHREFKVPFKRWMLEMLSVEITDGKPDDIRESVADIDRWFAEYPHPDPVSGDVVFTGLQERWKKLRNQLEQQFLPEETIVQSHHGKIDEINKERQKAIKDGQNALSPSEAARHSNFSTEQTNHPMKIGRPFESTGPPVSIYHPVFANFQTRSRGENYQPRPKDVVLAYKFIQKASQVYPNEESRLSKLNPLLGNFLGRPISGAASNKPRPDGLVLHHLTSGGDVPLLVIEVKNDIGTGGSDPDLQGSYSYRKLWAAEESPTTPEYLQTIQNVSCCPCFILSMAGPHIAIHGGVFTTDFITQPLTEIVKLANFPDPAERAEYIAKLMAALRDSIDELASFYDNLTPSPNPEPACYSPFFQEYEGFTLTYTSGDLFHRIGRAMFNATVQGPGEEGGSPVKVKFTPRYCEEAHRLLAEKKLAPNLRHFEKLENGWKVVVMDCVFGPNLESAKLDPVPRRVIQDIQEAIGLLHEKDWVHGDIRRPNVMLCDRDAPDGRTEQGAMLIDFDWVGKAGKHRYPPGLNTDAIKWAPGVESYGIMKKEHDEAMLKSLSR